MKHCSSDGERYTWLKHMFGGSQASVTESARRKRADLLHLLETEMLEMAMK